MAYRDWLVEELTHETPPDERPAKPYIVLQRAKGCGPSTYDVIHLGPYIVAKDLRQIEAESLAHALNEEHKDR